MTTQLRLVEAPETSESPRPAVKRPTADKRAQPRKAVKTSKALKAGKATGTRRAVHWGDWQLDARTRRIGRAGVAAARQALNEARAAEQLSEAS